MGSGRSGFAPMVLEAGHDVAHTRSMKIIDEVELRDELDDIMDAVEIAELRLPARRRRLPEADNV